MTNVILLLQGQRLINTDNYDDPEVLRHHLTSLLRNDPKLTRERYAVIGVVLLYSVSVKVCLILYLFLHRFFKYFEKARNEVSRKKNQTPHAAFRQLDLKKKNYLTAKDINRLPSNLLGRVANMFIRPEDDEEKVLKDEL